MNNATTTSPSPSRCVVLLIDDQPIVGEAIRRILAEEPDIEFHYCRDPAQAVPTARELCPTVILQDLVMPDIDGLTLLKFYRVEPTTRETPVIVLSTKEEATTKAEAFALGASDYLVKLPDAIEIKARIRHHSKGYVSLLERNAAYKALSESQRRLAQEVAKASKYVESLLPQPLQGPVFASWRFIPSEELGGDSFGYHWIDAEHFAVYLLDVCGHGVGAALLSVSALNVLRAMSLPDTDFRDPGQVITGLNRTFKMEDHNDMYFTIWYGVYRPTSRLLAYAGGGHPPALLLAGGGATPLAGTGPIIGAFPELDYSSLECEVPAGARLYIYSDGVFEIARPDGAMWTFDEFIAFMMAAGDSSSTEPMDALWENARSMRAGLPMEDDFSIVEVRMD